MTSADPVDRSALRFRFPDGELDTWFAVGDVTDRSVRVWARRPAGPAIVRLAIEDGPRVEASLFPEPDHDHVGAQVLELPRPAPGSRYVVDVDGTRREGRLAPDPMMPAPFRFAFGSCHQPFRERPLDGELVRHPNADIYPRLRAELTAVDASFLLLVGDQVYSDAFTDLSVRQRLAEDPGLADDELVDTYRHLYRGSFNERGFRELVDAFPTYLTWDDHDIYDGAGSLLHPTAFDARLRAAAEVAYREYQHLRNPGGQLADRAPYAYSFWYARTGFHVLDLRGVRDVHADRVVGEQGWRRLDAFLEEADDRDVPTVFLGVSVPVVHGSPRLMAITEGLPTSTGKDIRDRWSVPSLRDERSRLLERLFDWQAARPRRQVVLLSGDVHVGAAFSVRPRQGPGRILQWTSSALTTPSGLQHALANRLVTGLVAWGEDDLRVRQQGLVTANNAGLVRVEPLDGGGHRITFRILAFDPRRPGLRRALGVIAEPPGGGVARRGTQDAEATAQAPNR